MLNNKSKVPIWTRNFIGITMINLFIFLGFQMLLPTLPLYVASIGGSDIVLGWIVGLSTIAALIARPLSGLALDRFGRKGILFLGGIIVILATLSYIWFPIIGIILILRFVHGLGWGILSTASNTVASDIIPKKRFGEGMGYFSLSTSLAMALAPAIGLAIFNSSYITGLSLFSIGFGAIALLIALLIPFPHIQRENVTKTKLAPYERASILPSLIMFLVTASYGSITGFISLYAVEQGIANIGIFFFVYAIAMVITRPIFGKLIDNISYSAAVYPGLLLLIGGIISLAHASTLVIFILSGLLYGMGFGAIQTSLQTMSIAYAPTNRFGAANATFFTGFDGGIGFGAVIAGLVVSVYGYSQMYLIFTLFPIFAGLLYFLFRMYWFQKKLVANRNNVG